jgi:lipopolysaccharide/colanic/teichoic acid biosynthesis glycosyltransferase
MYERWGKRVLDAAGAAALLALLAPLMALVALAVLLALGRPVLFRQARAGRGGRPFVLLKFRSMAEGPGADAARLGRFGRALRASALDELPQLLHVLRGEMSMVGPRPLLPEYGAFYTERQARRLRVRPGLAGLAQAAGRNAVSWERRLALDARYAERRPTFRTDARIAARCLALVLRGRGASAPGHATMPAFGGDEGRGRHGPTAPRRCRNRPPPSPSPAALGGPE